MICLLQQKKSKNCCIEFLRKICNKWRFRNIFDFCFRIFHDMFVVLIRIAQIERTKYLNIDNFFAFRFRKLRCKILIAFELNRNFLTKNVFKFNWFFILNFKRMFINKIFDNIWNFVKIKRNIVWCNLKFKIKIHDKIACKLIN